MFLRPLLLLLLPHHSETSVCEFYLPKWVHQVGWTERRQCRWRAKWNEHSLDSGSTLNDYQQPDGKDKNPLEDGIKIFERLHLQTTEDDTTCLLKNVKNIKVGARFKGKLLWKLTQINILETKLTRSKPTDENVWPVSIASDVLRMSEGSLKGVAF